MKKKQLDRKLSLNKQTLSLLDAQAMHAIKGGLVAPANETSQAGDKTCVDCPG